MKTVFVLVDALKSLYLTEENMPFLYQLSKESYYIQHIIPCAGFCERSEIFSGLDGFDTGNFTAIGYMPESSPYQDDKNLLRVFSVVEKIDGRLCNRPFNRWRIKNHRALNKYRIPFSSLYNFSLTEDGLRKFTQYSTLFSRLEESEKSYTLKAFTSLADFAPRIRASVSDFAKTEIDRGTFFIPLYIGIIDAMGHKYGADIDAIRPYLQEVDNKLREIFEYAIVKGYSFAVMGDHGMVPVTQKIDVMTSVKKSRLKLGKDYEAFYDSTMARFWFYNKTAEIRVRELLNEKLGNSGFIVDQSNFREYRIPLDIYSSTGKPIYGEIVWCANPGVLVSPDYFHSLKESENGMHGYIEVVKGHGTGLFVASSDLLRKSFIEEEHSSAICNLLSDLLEVENPNSSLWNRKII